MTFRFFERPNSRSGGSFPPTFQRLYRATGSNDSSFVRAIAQSSTPGTVVVDEGILYRQDVKVNAFAFNIFDVEVTYAARNATLGSASISFDTTGGTLHISAAKESIAKFPDTSRSYGGLIGVEGKNVIGADVVIPASKRTVTFRHPAGFMSLSQMDYLEEITGTVNSATFMGRPAGEVLFLGAKGSEGTDAETQVAYDFAFSKNLASVSIAGISGVTKKGWHLYWIDHAPDDDAGKPVRRARAIYVERVYDEINLAAALGFGG